MHTREEACLCVFACAEANCCSPAVHAGMCERAALVQHWGLLQAQEDCLFLQAPDSSLSIYMYIFIP